jgi:hypothetical protein
MKLCAIIETPDKQDIAYFTTHGSMRNALFVHTEVDNEGRPSGHTALMVRFPAGERGKVMGNCIYLDLTKREGYERVKHDAVDESNVLELVRSYLPECRVLK